MSSLAIDVGSSFADLAFTDGTQLGVLKFPINAQNGGQDEGTTVLRAIDAAAQRYDFAIKNLTSVCIGSTGAINAVLQRKGARIALLATEGFTDTFFLARQNRQDLYDPVATSRTPHFLLNEADVYPVAGRIGADGQEVSAPNTQALAQLAQQIAADGIDAVAVCLLFSHLNPTHEQMCLDVLSQHCPDIPISLSHHVDPQPREYERTVSVCLDAWLKPQFTRACTQVSGQLSKQGFVGQLLYGDGRGALMSAQTALKMPATAFASGPAAAARHGARISAHGTARSRLIMDIGSVSCDLSYAPKDALPPLVPGAVYGGVPLRRDMIDLHSFALGARHVAVLQSDHRLTFETRDTANGATLELALRTVGRLLPDVDTETVAPLATLAKQAGWRDAQEAAQQIIAAAELEIAGAVVNFAVRRNVDPSHAQLVAMGGIGPLLAPGVAKLLSIREILLPQAPAAAGALGLLQATPRLEAAVPIARPLSAVTADHLSKIYADLQADIDQQKAAMRNTDLLAPTAVFTVAATAQMHPMQFEMSPPPQNPADIKDAFCAAYQARYAIEPPGDGFVFSLLLRREGAGSPVPDAIAHELGRDDMAPERLQTAAGTLYVPINWSLYQTKNGFSLLPKETRE